MLALPDKRKTPDSSRQSTSVYKLLERYHQEATSPTLSEVMDFARFWVEDLANLEKNSPKEFFDWAVGHFQSGNVDIHCNVWKDTEFFEQIEYLIKGGFVYDLSVLRKEKNKESFNEFYMLLASTR